MNRVKLLLLAFVSLLQVPLIQSQNPTVDVNLNFNHKLGDVEEFDRAKFVTIHADITEPEWGTNWGSNFTPNVRDHFLNGYDVYMGRNTGPITGGLYGATEDPSRPGYADVDYIETYAQSLKTSYGNVTGFHSYEHRNNQVIAAQLHPFWSGNHSVATSAGWFLSDEDTAENPFGTASGEYMAHFLKNAYGTGGATGQPAPTYVEVINEPMYELVTTNPLNDVSTSDIAKFHVTVANEVKALNPDTKIGGYCTAFPDFEKSNFARWNDRWKTFMDEAGEDMDYWSIHLYDFPTFGNTEQYRKGSNMEATLDMMEQYSYLSFDEVKPFVVSEFGASVHDLQGAWSPYRDWVIMKSVSSMMVQFMEHADVMAQTINFLIIKATWGYAGGTNTYPHRLLRRANEPSEYSGEWVYTEMIKLYELWSNVNGKRVESRSTDLDIMTDTYVEGDKAYVILNNLGFTEKEVNLNLIDNYNTNISGLYIKQLHLEGPATVAAGTPVLSEEVFSTDFPTTVTLKPEATMILEYTFDSDITIDELMTETKHYSDIYLQEITANTEVEFNVDGLTLGTQGEATLRVGVGRAHSLSLTPTIEFNGVEVSVPDNIRGDNQEDRAEFFGVLEIPVPFSLLQANNVVGVTFPDTGGHISSVTLQSYDLTDELVRSDKVTDVAVYPTSVDLGIAQVRQLTATLTPATAINQLVTWSSSDPGIVSVNSATGAITGVALGTATVTATTDDGGFTADCAVEVFASYIPVDVDIVTITPIEGEVLVDGTLQLEYEVLPVDADDQTLTWSSDNTSFVTVDNSGLVSGVADGLATITAEAHNGVQGTSNITAITRVPGYANFIGGADAYINATYTSGGTMEVSCEFEATTLEKVNADGIQFWLREITDETTFIPNGEKDVIASDVSVVGQSSGTASAVISLEGVTATEDLEPGHFYFLWIRFFDDNGGEVVNQQDVWPITILPDPTASVDGFDTEGISVYPNPADDNIQITSSSSISHVELYSTIGNVVLTSDLVNDTIDVSGLAEGVYFVKLYASEDNTVIVKKVVIKH